MDKEPHFATRCVHAGEEHHPFGAHATPIYQTSTYVFDSAEQAAAAFSGGPGYRYVRTPPHTPTHAAFIEKICSLEGGQAGLAFSSGMAAETALVLSLLQKGDHLLSTDVIYGGTYGLFSSILPKFGIEVSFVDTTEPEKVKAGLRESTRLIFLETPANPTMAVSDIAQIDKIAHEAGARLAVDNTFATPYFQRPLALGADAVVESCTKYIGGHGDLLGGVAVGPEELISSMKRTALLTGGTMGTHEGLALPEGLQDTAPEDGEACRERPCSGTVSGKAPSRAKGQLSGPSQPSPACPGEEADERLGWHALLRGERRSGCRPQAHEPAEAVQPGGQLGQCRYPGRASRLHDPCRHAQRDAGKDGNCGRAGEGLGGH
jgi:hypothetical protein